MQINASVEPRGWRLLCFIHHSRAKWVCLLFNWYRREASNTTRRCKQGQQNKGGNVLNGKTEMLPCGYCWSEAIKWWNTFVLKHFFNLTNGYGLQVLYYIATYTGFSTKRMFQLKRRFLISIPTNKLLYFLRCLETQNKTITQKHSISGPIGAPSCQPVHMGRTTHRARKRATPEVTARKSTSPPEE